MLVLKSPFNKVAALKASYFIKETPTQMFFCEYRKTFMNTHYEKQLQMAASVPSVSKIEK